MLYRIFAFLPILLVTSLLPGCVSIPEQVQLLHRHITPAVAQQPASCHAPRQSLINVSQHSGPALDARQIRLLNWNIYKAQEAGWQEDFQQLVAEKDILVIQEALMDPRLTRVLDNHRFNWSLNTAFYYDKLEAGVMTASRIPAIKSCGLRAEEPLIQIPKTMLVNEYPLSAGQGTLLVANIHGINFTLGTEAYAEQIQALVSAIQQHKGPMIVAGDFNTWSDRRMDIVMEMAQQLSLKSVEYKSHNRVTILGNPLDHVFYRDLEVIEESTLKVDSSDHNPMQVTFSVANLPRNWVKI